MPLLVYNAFLCHVCVMLSIRVFLPMTWWRVQKGIQPIEQCLILDRVHHSQCYGTQCDCHRSACTVQPGRSFIWMVSWRGVAIPQLWWFVTIFYDHYHMCGNGWVRPQRSVHSLTSVGWGGRVAFLSFFLSRDPPYKCLLRFKGHSSSVFRLCQGNDCRIVLCWFIGVCVCPSAQ